MDSEDDILKFHDVNSYASLQQPVCQRCDFCDKTFTSRLAIVKHNATHIIIPLLKLTLHQCDECLFHFSSLKELHAHATAKNHITSQFPNKASQPKPIAYEVLQSIVEKQALVKCHDTLYEVLSPKLYNNTPKTALNESNSELIEKKSLDKCVIYEISSDSDTESPDISEKGQSSLEKGLSSPKKGHSNPEGTTENEDRESSPFQFNSLIDLGSPTPSLTREELSSPIQPLKSRIMFEDDFNDDLFEPEEILPDKPYRKISCGNETNYNNKRRNSFIIGTQLFSEPLLNETTDNVKIEESYTKSVHYDDLISPDMCDCKYCGRCFRNRFEEIKHETIHMRATFARPILCAVCERYLAGNYWALRRHMQRYHPTHERKLLVQQCKICHMKYHNYRRHIQYYHQIKCDACKRSFSKQDLETHDCIDKILKKNGIEIDDTLTSDSYKVIKMCEICLAFAKNKQNIQYEVIGEHSELGIQQCCDKCHNKHFEVSLVRRKVKFREGTETWKRRKPLSNQERLKKMQNRLKMFNKMSKC